MQTRAYVALGGNLDDPRAQIERGFAALSALPRSRLVARSSLYRSAPWGVHAQPDFINAAAALDTSLPPRALLDALLTIERAAGRTRDSARWGPRTLDLDLLLYGDKVLHEPRLKLPHPCLHERAFVLLPLNDLAPDLEVPGRGRVADLLEAIDTADCTPII